MRHTVRQVLLRATHPRAVSAVVGGRWWGTSLLPVRHFHHHWQCFIGTSPSLQFGNSRNVSSVIKRSPQRNVHILYASQTGTAQLFAMQLAQAIMMNSSTDNNTTKMTSLQDVSASDLQSDVSYVVLASTTGVGEPPDSARAFMESLRSCESLSHIQYSIFGLGNSRAHPNHFCAFAKDLDAALRHKEASCFMELTLGDDGGMSIEQDFDTWQERLLALLKDPAVSGSSILQETSTSPVEPNTEQNTEHEQPIMMARLPSSFPALQLTEPPNSLTPSSTNLLHQCPDFYMPNTFLHQVLHNEIIRHDIDHVNNPSALREVRIQLRDGETYKTGDHLVVYPQNNDTMVEAYLDMVDDCPNPHSIVTTDNANYPHPTNISVYDTLRHCVDLSTVPSPSFARFLLKGSAPLDYNTDICRLRLTPLEVLNLANDSPPKMGIADLLYQLPKLAPRYYSIASSNLRHPDTVYLTYRPVQYVNAKGNIKEGLCTSFLSRKPKSLVAAIRSNPTFRLPTDTNVPILLIAGGCGVAPIRAFLEELVYLIETGTLHGPPHVHLYLGFRDPNDQVYQELIDQAQDVLASQHVTFTRNCVQCSLVSDAILKQSADLYNLLTEQNASVFICGGARTFGVAIQNAIREIMEREGPMDAPQATLYLQDMIRSGRFHEDLSD